MMDDIGLRESEAFLLYNQQDYTAAKQIFQDLHDSGQHDTDDERTRLKFNIASCEANLGNLDEAMKLVTTLKGSSNCLLYNKAVCEYKCGNFTKAVAILDEVIINCERDYPDLMVIDERQLNKETQINVNLRDSCLIEAINLKAACLYKISGDKREAKQVLSSCPIKSLELLDSVTLFNQALYDFTLAENDQSIQIFLYLHDLLQQQKTRGISQEISQNLIHILIESEHLNLASDLLQNTRVGLEQFKELLRYFELKLECFNLTENELYEKMDLFLDHILRMIKNTNPTSCSMKSTRHELVDLAMTIVDHQCNILWANDRYKSMEKLLQKVKFVYQPDYIDIWTKTMGHLLFMMDTRFEECSYLYEKFIPKNDSEENFHDVDPIVLSNLCVSYVLTGRNGDAEALIKQIEQEEQQQETTNMSSLENEDEAHFRLAKGKPHNHRSAFSPPSHLSIINLAIETLYCLKNNHEFGLTRMFKTLEANEHRLNVQTWFQAKRCILSLLDSHCRQQIYIRDDLLNQIVSFLMRCERSGIQMADSIGTRASMLSSLKSSSAFKGTRALGQSYNQDTMAIKHLLKESEIITLESRYLRSILLGVIHD